jgi:hypothetical protein
LRVFTFFTPVTEIISRYTSTPKHFDCIIDLEEFDLDYEKNYLNKVSSEFLRKELMLDESVKIKKNGTFKRWLYIYVGGTLERKRVKIQKFQYIDYDGKIYYASVFPSCIFKYNPLHEELIDLVISNVGKGEDILKHVNDNTNIIDSEDIIANSCKSIEKKISSKKLLETMTAKYTTVLNMIPEFKSSGARYRVLLGLKHILQSLYPEAFSPLSLLNRLLWAV